MRGRILALGLLTVGCASELATSARTDELPTFKRKLEAAQQLTPPKLDSDQLREVAQVVASRELVTARARDAEARVVEVTECVSPLEDALSTLSERRDSAGALAVQVLIDARRFDGELGELSQQHASDKQDDWRAVGLRASVAPSDGKLRLAGFVDPDLRVRRAALRAAKDARSPSEVTALLEAARLDPDRVSRRFALEAIAAIAERDSLARLRELWPAADEQERLEITKVWASDRGFAAGGEQQLGWVLSTQSGTPQLSAAATLLRKQAQPLEGLAEEVLATAIASGPVEESRHALAVTPATPKVTSAVQAAAKDKDESRAVAAAIVLSRSTPDRTIAVKRLKELRASSDAAIAAAASFALAATGEPDAVKWVDSQLSAKDPERRLQAGVVKYADGNDVTAVSKAAGLLADSDASVRVRFACWALRDERPPLDYLRSQLRP
jgi:HEAT repeat protein